MYYDLSYLVLVVPALLISLWAQFKVNSAFSNYSKVRTMRGLTERRRRSIFCAHTV